MRIQVGPPGSVGMGNIGIAGASPTPEVKRQQSMSLQQQQQRQGGQPPDSGRREAVILSGDSKLMRRVQALEDLAPDSPALRKAINLVSVLVDLFKLAMASMLGVFVPQLCPGNEVAFGGSGNCTNISGPHDCSFEENFRCLVPFNQWVLVRSAPLTTRNSSAIIAP